MNLYSFLTPFLLRRLRGKILRIFARSSLSYSVLKYLAQFEPQVVIDNSRHLLSSVSQSPPPYTGVAAPLQPASIELSIIVPVYNTSSFLSDCLDSILDQCIHYDYEVILINDGSNDCSLEVCRSYESRNSSIRVIDQNNRGLASARNVGLESSRGELICFVDSDDMLAPGYINRLVRAIYQAGCDYVTTGYCLINENGRELNKVISQERSHGGVCGRIFRRSVWNRLRFPDGYLFEDTIMSLCVQTHHHGELLNDSGYLYRLHGASITARRQDPKNLDTFWVIEYIIDYLNYSNIPMTCTIYRLILKQCGPIMVNRTAFLNSNHRRALLVAASELLSRLDQFSGTATRLERCWKDLEAALQNKKYLLWLLAACRIEVDSQ